MIEPSTTRAAPSTDPAKDRALALARFGLGARLDDPAGGHPGGGDPRTLLLDDLAAGVAMPAGSDLTDSAAALTELRRENDLIRRAREAPPPVLPPDVQGPPAPPYSPPSPSYEQRVYRAEAAARLALALAAPVGFAERWVRFWTNHFAVSAAKGGNVRAICGAFEREAIRPHALGRLGDMLVAATTHPAMLLFLDNTGSVGPNSPAGQRRGRGLNENLGREVLELHTLGVGGGYGQDDVGALARILTGWTVAGQDGRLGRPGAAAFNANAHEPGPLTLLGRSYADEGAGQLEAALRDLAGRPATAAHLARKIARHFVGDAAPDGLVKHLAATFDATGGDLAAVARALVAAPEAWTGPGRLRTPQEFLVAALRALGTKPDRADANGHLGRLGLLGEPLWTPSGPDGHPDTDAAWLAPEGMRTRLDLAARLAAGAGGVEPRALLDGVLGPRASAETRAAVLRAESRPQAVALVLMAPEFQRR